MSSNRIIEALIANEWLETSTPGRYKSKTISHSQTTSVIIENIRQISFDYSVSSEGNRDWFNFYINGRQNISQSGTISDSFEYSSDTPFNIKFEYTKDRSANRGDDCVYISNIKYREPSEDLVLDNGVVITYFEEKRIIGENYDYIADTSNNLWIKGDGKLLGTYEDFTKIEDISDIQELVSLTDNECIYMDTSNNLWIKGEKYNKIYEEFTLIEGYDINELINFIYNSDYYLLLSEDEINIMNDINNGNWETHFSSEEEKDEFIINLYNKYEITEEMFAEKENEYKEYLINLYEKYLYINTFYDSKDNKEREYKIRIKNLEANNSVYLFDSYIKNYKYRQIDDIYSDSIDEYSFKYELIENENNIHKFSYKTLPGDYSLSIDDNLNGDIKIYLDGEEYNLIQYNGYFIIFIDDKNVEHNIEIIYDGNNLNNFYCYINRFIKRSVKLNSDKYYLKILGNENFDIAENNIEYIDFIFDMRYSNRRNYYINKYLKETTKNSYQIELIKKNKENIKYINSISSNNSEFSINKSENENKLMFKFIKPVSSTPFYNNTQGIKIVSIKKQCTNMSFYYKTSSSSNFVYLYIDGEYKSNYSSSSWRQAVIDKLTDEEHEFTWVLYSYSTNYYSCIDTIAFDDVVEEDSNNFSNTYEKELEYYKNGTLSTTPFYNNAPGFKVVSIKKQCTKMSFYYKTSSSDFVSIIYLYIDGMYKKRYYNTSWTQAVIDNLTDEEHEFTWVLYSYNNDYNYSCIDTIAFDDIVEENRNNFSNNGNIPLADIPTNNTYKNGTNSSTPFYNDIPGPKIVSIKKRCTYMSFYYKTYNVAHIYLYIDGLYKSTYSNSSWRQVVINNLTNTEHEFTWILNTNGYYSCIDTIAFNSVVETDRSKFSNTYEKELVYINYTNGTLSTTPFYNNAPGFKTVSIKKRCTKMSFYYKTKSGNYVSNSVYLYIDEMYIGKYNNTSWTQIAIDDLTNEEHEFTWVLYSSSNSYYSCIDTIAFNDIVEEDSGDFTYIGNIPLADIPTDNKYTIDGRDEIIGLNYLNISFSQVYYVLINMVLDIEYLNRQKKYFENIKKLNNIKENLDVLIFNNLESYFLEKEKNTINSDYMNDTNSSTPFYIDKEEGIKIVSIKKRCTKMSFYYKVYNGNNNYFLYLYIDGEYKSNYSSSSWRQAVIDNLTNAEHEFTWILHNNNGYYSCIDTIAFDDIIETDRSKFSNTYEKELKDVINNKYINGALSATPFYITEEGIKIVSIKKRCTKMSFYYKVYNSNNNYFLYLYIDGEYKSNYSSSSWRQAVIDNLTNAEHEFTWVLCNKYSGSSFYLCIDTIAFNDMVEKDSSKFSNICSLPLADIPTDETYKNSDISSTPFYNYTRGVKIVSIKKQCIKMSFYYKVNSSNYTSVYLYIDGVYKSSYSNTSWSRITINNLTDEEHEFTWVLYSSGGSYYSCIDTIAFDDVVEEDSNNFSNTYEKELIYDIYKNGILSTTPFYNKYRGFKIVSIKKKCTKMSFYYKVYSSNYNNTIYLYIDGIYKGRYYSYSSWGQININDLTDEEHEFTWVLHSYEQYYSCIDTIAFNDIIEEDSSKFSFKYNIKYKFNFIEPKKDISFSEQKNKLNEEKYNEFVLVNRKNKIFKINPNNYSELESILQSPDIIDLVISNDNGDHIILTTKAKQRIFTRDIDTNEPNMPFIIKSNPNAIGSLKVSNVKTEFNKSDLEVTNEVDIDELTNENEDFDFEDIENGYCMKIEDINE